MSVIAGENNINNVNMDIIREDLVQTAVKFLQNPKVVNTSLAQKQKFLQRKGLTDQEIQAACEQSGAYDVHEQLQIVPKSAPIRNYNQVYTRYGEMQQITWFSQLKEFIHNTALLSAVIYAIYMFYQKFIRRFLFGDKKKSLESSIDDLEKSVKSAVGELRTSLDSVKVEVDKISQSNGNDTQRQLQELKSEISSVKGLLLSRKQFPPVSSNSPVVPPSIPAWQMASVPPDTDTEQDPKAEELLEIGSGSGSSEPEHITKNSDSSLEIIYSYKHDPNEGAVPKYSKQSSEDDS